MDLNLTDKKVLIIGKGISGKGASKAVELCGGKSVMADESDIDGLLNDKYDLIVVSPSIAKQHRIFEAAKKSETEIIGEIELGWRINKTEVIAVTGTNGKTTTCELIAAILAKSRKTALCGNVGVSYSLTAAEGGYATAVVEVSSFQLETVKTFKPHIAVITNIGCDHMDRHKTFKEYAAVKRRITECQSENDFLILSADDIPLFALEGLNTSAQVVYTSLKGEVSGAYTDDGKIYYFDEFICSASRVKMQGIHNMANALSAVCAAKIMGIQNSDIIDALTSFECDAHRMQYIECINGVSFYDDSKGTNIGATVKAMMSMPSSTCLILGGSDKGYEFDGLFYNMPKEIKKICVIGETSKKILDAAFRAGFNNIKKCADLKEAVIEAYHSGADNVLLSPATASFDMFKDYKHRGEVFVNLIKGIKESENGY